MCENIVTGERNPVHAQRLRRYADAQLQVTEDLKDQAAHDKLAFFPDKIVSWREADEGTMQLRVRWLGFEPNEDSWEDLQTFYADAPVMVRRYVQGQRRRAPALVEAMKEL